MKKQRFKFTKVSLEHITCGGCFVKLNRKNRYGRRWGACNETCYLHSVGMSWNDFL